MKKLSVLLATTDQLAPSFKKGISDTGKYFKQNQGAFKGLKKTYDPLPETIDEPTKRGFTSVISTVDEKLAWIVESTADYIDALFSQEATNASGNARAKLIVDGIVIGDFSTLELMRLKSILESEGFSNMYELIPTREDTKIWRETDLEDFEGRKIFQDTIVKGEHVTTDKENYIMQDPNMLAAITAGKTFNYTPVQGVKTKTVKLGNYTTQNFSGEASHRERAEIMRRVTKLKTAVLEALKTANDVESIESDMTSSKLFNYLHKGTL